MATGLAEAEKDEGGWTKKYSMISSDPLALARAANLFFCIPVSFSFSLGVPL